MFLVPLPEPARFLLIESRPNPSLLPANAFMRVPDLQSAYTSQLQLSEFR